MNRIKELRVDNDIKQQYIANMLSITQAQYSRIECNKYELDYNGLTVLSEFYRVNIDYLLGLTDVDKFFPRRKNDKK